MKSKLNFLISMSLKKKIKSKWFVVANILLGLLIIGVINLDSIITYFGGDFNEKQEILVIDETNKAFDIFKTQMDLSNITGQVEMDEEIESDYDVKLYTKSLEEAKEEVTEKSSLIIVVFEYDENNVITATLITEGYLDLIKNQLVNNALNNTKISLAIDDSSISTEELAKIYEPIVVNRVFLDETKKEEDSSSEMIMSTVFPLIILPFFMLTIFLVQMIGAEVNDEKATRGMEIIISNVSPKTHFFSKVIAGNLFVLMQGALLLAFTGLGFGVRRMVGGTSITGGLGTEVGDMINQLLTSGLGDKLIYVIPLTVILMLLAFIAYSLLAGILASMTTNIEDFQQLQTPIMIISLIGYYLSFMANMFQGAVFIKVISYIPLISAILSPSLLVLGQIGLIDIIISIALNIGLIYLLIKYGLRIYKVGILNYSSSKLWQKMFKAVKRKENM